MSAEELKKMEAAADAAELETLEAQHEYEMAKQRFEVSRINFFFKRTAYLKAKAGS